MRFGPRHLAASLAIFCLAPLAAVPAVAAPDPDSIAARRALLAGRHDEARTLYERMSRRDPVAGALGVARAREAAGERDEAMRALEAAAARSPAAAGVHAMLARLKLDRGDTTAAQRHVDAALAADEDQAEARWVAAELHRTAGRLDDADIAYRWLVRRYNRDRGKISDPELLHWIGLGAAQYARWHRNSSQFSFLVNTLYPDALKADSTFWPAHLEAARLFIEKYNRRDASDEIASGLRLNPRAAELHAAHALIAFQQFDLDSAHAAIDRALALDPGLLDAHLVRADVQIVTGRLADAAATLERARALNPMDERTLGRLAATWGAIDGLRSAPSGRMATVITEAERRNPRAGEFYAALGASLDLMRKYPHAARWFEEATRRMPQLVTAHGALGMVHMRLGEEEKARGILKEAFDADPFNLRVNNSIEVLELLDGYGTIETDHFVVRFDPGHDSLLARHAARYLEDEVHPEIVKALGYTPPGKSLFEIFGPAKNESGHSWFSTRMVGMPFIGTVGACAGKIVAITSPNDGDRLFNWARVLKHEFVHVVNLQQTDFNVPQWFTEGLAVVHEGPGRPITWDQVLARRSAAGRLFDLGTIQLGFSRPSSGDDWTLAYYQAELYVRYMTATYGEAAAAKMLAGYADHLDTRAALKRAFGVTLEAFEQGYRAHVASVVAAGGPPPAAAPGDEDPVALERSVRANPRDAAALARLAQVDLDRERPDDARDRASAALAADSTEQLAALVLARLHVADAKKPEARAMLRRVVSEETPHLEALTLLVNLTIEAEDWPEAERLSTIGAARFPRDAEWGRGLAEAYRGSAQNEKLAVVLARLAERRTDDFDLRLELARLARDRADHEAAARWAREATFVDVRSAEAHALRGAALAEQGQAGPAIEACETAVSLAPESPEWRLALARALVRTGAKERARSVIDDLLRRDPGHAAAREMLQSL